MLSCLIFSTVLILYIYISDRWFLLCYIYSTNPVLVQNLLLFFVRRVKLRKYT